MNKKWIVLVTIIFVSVFIAACGSESSSSEGNGEEAESQGSESESENNDSASAELPEGDIQTMIPVAEGGGTDTTHRGLADIVEEYLDRNVVVNNVTGSGGSVGFSEAANYEGDGSHLFSYTSEIFTLPIYQENTGFKPEDFKPLLNISHDPAAIVVSADSEYETLDDFIQAAEENPGQISIGNSGFGNIWHLSATAFEKEAGIEFKQVPYDGAAETVQATLGGHIDSFVASPPEVASQVEAGELRILATMAEERSEHFPDVPTLSENDIEISIGTWRGLGVPSDTPNEIVTKLEEAYSQAINSEEFEQFMDEQGMNIRFMNNEDFTEFVENERPRFEQLAQEAEAQEE
ncbi:tripartite tricarboxylate transporter substrate binding protein [Salibacterium aidingense]|uniref:tripartite tricarboxylate transporter substrate binding protein n=1 Tax=Salibacterium aidingense TaxID=384933 RepID=UPI000400612F|nr:tripartite tricarboxylate transporter substrate binding protein [Salibacterium aidingense]